MTIKYSKGYKYQLEEVYACFTPVTGVTITDDMFELRENGLLVVKRGFAWDGASGPTVDSASSMRPSLVHDVFCVCMRDGRLDYDRWHNVVNDFFRQQCVEAGMWEWRAALWCAAVKFADAGNPKQGPDRKILTAP